MAGHFPRRRRQPSQRYQAALREGALCRGRALCRSLLQRLAGRRPRRGSVPCRPATRSEMVRRVASDDQAPPRRRDGLRAGQAGRFRGEVDGPVLPPAPAAEALRHIFAVAGFAGQPGRSASRRCWARSGSTSLSPVPPGLMGGNLEEALQAAYAAAKRVRSETGLRGAAGLHRRRRRCGLPASSTAICRAAPGTADRPRARWAS